MAKVLYTAQAHVTGGREQGHGVTSDGALDVQLRTPKEMGGAGGGTNPGSSSRSATPRVSRGRSASWDAARRWTWARSPLRRRSA